jgi:threonine/homoserine/homoserine lactone efflux protein
MTDFLLGVSLGFSAGVSPGPLLALVITTALNRGFRSGVRVALAPILTDAPLIVAALTVSASLPAAFLAALTLAGGVFVVYLGFETLRASRRATLTVAGRGIPPIVRGQDIWRGAAVNLLDPNPEPPNGSCEQVGSRTDSSMSPRGGSGEIAIAPFC